MTIRQFLSILINAGIFGNFASVSMLGWTGVFWYAPVSVHFVKARC